VKETHHKKGKPPKFPFHLPEASLFKRRKIYYEFIFLSLLIHLMNGKRKRGKK